MNLYIGHDLQLGGVEEYRLVGGKGDGMRLYQIRNGKGLELEVSPDRAGERRKIPLKSAILLRIPEIRWSLSRFSTT